MNYPLKLRRRRETKFRNSTGMTEVSSFPEYSFKRLWYNNRARRPFIEVFPTRSIRFVRKAFCMAIAAGGVGCIAYKLCHEFVIVPRELHSY